jgi:M61 glycyl aminopeptidase
MLRLLAALAFATSSALGLVAQETDPDQASVSYRLSRDAERAWISVTASFLASAEGSVELEWVTRRFDEPRKRRFRGDQIRDLRAFAGPTSRRLRVENAGPRWFLEARPFERVTLEWKAPPNSVAPRQAPAKELEKGFLLDASEVLLRVTHLAERPHTLSFAADFDPDLSRIEGPLVYDGYHSFMDYRPPCGAREGQRFGTTTRSYPLHILGGDAIEDAALAKFSAGLNALVAASDPPLFLSNEGPGHHLVLIDSKRRGMRGPFILFTPLTQLADNPNAALRLIAREMFLGYDRRQILAQLGGLPHPEARDALWFSEGISVYLGDLTAVRAKLISRAQFLQGLKSLADRELKAPGTFAVTGDELGRALTDHRGAGDGPSAAARGALLCFCLDTLLRDEDGRGGLREHRRLWTQFARAKVPASLPLATQKSLRRFFARHVRGSAFPPLEAAFARYGLRYRRQLLRSDMSFAWARRDQGIVVTDPRKFPGLKAGDFVLEINGREDYDIAKILSGSAKKRKLRLLIARGKQTSRATAGLQDRRRWLTELAVDEKASPEMYQRRAAWLQ